MRFVKGFEHHHERGMTYFERINDQWHEITRQKFETWYSEYREKKIKEDQIKGETDENAD